jgi:hypothetical protein
MSDVKRLTVRTLDSEPTHSVCMDEQCSWVCHGHKARSEARRHVRNTGHAVSVEVRSDFLIERKEPTHD